MLLLRSSSPSQNLGVKTVFVLGGPAAVPDTVVDFLKGLNTSCTTDTQCGGVSNSVTNGDPRVAPGTKLTVARIQDPLNDTRYGTMRLLNILTGLPVSIPVVVQQVQPASVRQVRHAGRADLAGERLHLLPQRLRRLRCELPRRSVGGRPFLRRWHPDDPDGSGRALA